MTAAQLRRMPLRRVRPAIVIRPRQRTEPIVFVMPSREQVLAEHAAWSAYLEGRS